MASTTHAAATGVPAPTPAPARAGEGERVPEHLDVVIVGAGLAGIDAAYRLQTQCPGKAYAILEAREAMGGTWDLFRYPGVRSDSDMYTLGYPFRPWREAEAIADGPSILAYIRDTAREFGIDRKIRYGRRLVGADFDTATARWTLTVQRRDPAADPSAPPSVETVTCGFLFACTGYYDYEHPYDPHLPGLPEYRGTLVHPQFWPEELDWAGKRVVVIGSGATAVTLVPAMAATAGHVTMLQRSPSWVFPVPRKDAVGDAVRAVLPDRLAHRVVRAKNVVALTALYQLCRTAPRTARRLMTSIATKELGDGQVVREAFTPSYDPWDQRLCFVPDGDLFAAVKAGRASVVTDTIETFVPEGVRLASGRVLPADIVVTATGLQVVPVGGVRPTVDGQPVDLHAQLAWHRTMLTGLPNLALAVGYTNASWTLRADLNARLVCQVLRYMDERGYAAVVPVLDGPVVRRPLMDLHAGYLLRVAGSLPQQGDRGPWRVRQDYVRDSTAGVWSWRRDMRRTLQPLGPRGRAPAAHAAWSHRSHRDSRHRPDGMPR